MKAIVGELALTKGELKFDGRDISRGGPKNVSGSGSVTCRRSIRCLPACRARNLAVGALHNHDPAATDRVLAIFPKLAQRLDEPAGTSSGGERKMLAIGRALLGDPKLLLLDEPTEGVWVGVIHEITERLVLSRRKSPW